MVERLKYNAEEIVNNSKRLAKVDVFEKKSPLKEYFPSQTEILLEEMCISFRTKLEQAYVNPINETKLVRLSKPVVVTNRYTGEKNLLAMQYTRFSPLHDLGEVVEVYRKNNQRSSRKSSEKIVDEIYRRVREKNNGKWDTFREITNVEFIPDVKVGKWRKQFYFALFRLGEKTPEQEIKPFEIWDRGRVGGNLPDVHITFTREPLFVIGHRRLRIEGKEKSDNIYISFPRVWNETISSIEEAQRLCLVNKLDKSEFKQVSSSSGLDFEISMDSDLTLSFIQRYLNNRCFGTTL